MVPHKISASYGNSKLILRHKNKNSRTRLKRTQPVCKLKYDRSQENCDDVIVRRGGSARKEKKRKEEMK